MFELVSQYYCDMILDHVTKDPQEVFFDLDHRTARGTDFGFLHANRETRFRIQREYGRRNQITISMKTDEMRTSFQDWRGLRAWKAESISRLYPSDDNYYSHGMATAEPLSTIELNFISPTIAGLADIRIDITEFIRITYKLKARSVIHFRLKRTEESTDYEADYIITLEDLRKKCFLLISPVLERHQLRANVTCPEIWINGLGAAVEGRYGQPMWVHGKTVLNTHMNLGNDATLLNTMGSGGSRSRD